MKELEKIIFTVKQALAAKQQEIRRSSVQINHITEGFKNCQMQAVSLINSAGLWSGNPTEKARVIADFKKAAHDLLVEISKILV